MAFVIDLSPEQESTLHERAAARGLTAADYAKLLIERELRLPSSLDGVLAPFRREVQESGIADAELDVLFEEAHEEVFQERRTRAR